MPCFEILSEFEEPYKFGTDDCFVTRLNYETDTVETIELTSGITLADGCSGAIRLYWLNRKGGVDSFVFSGKYEKGITVSNGKIAITGNSDEFYYDKGITRDYIQIVSQPVLKKDIPALLTIVSSPWVWMAGTPPVYVNIEEGEFLYDVSNQSITQIEFRLTLAKLNYTQLR